MSQSLIITTKKENVFEFEAEVKGIRDPKMSVQFVIQAEDMNFAFPAKHDKENTWVVTIPPLKDLKHKDYPYMITLDLEGYHFEPLKGELTVVGEIEPSVSAPRTVDKKEESKPKPEPKKEEEKKPEVREEPKPEPKPEPKKVEEPEEKKDDVKEATGIDGTIANIIQREKLRRAPKDIAIRKVLGEVKAPKEIIEPEPVVTMEDVLAAEEDEAKRAKDAAVKAILSQVKNRT